MPRRPQRSTTPPFAPKHPTTLTPQITTPVTVATQTPEAMTPVPMQSSRYDSIDRTTQTPRMLQQKSISSQTHSKSERDTSTNTDTENQFSQSFIEPLQPPTAPNPIQTKCGSIEGLRVISLTDQDRPCSLSSCETLGEFLRLKQGDFIHFPESPKTFQRLLIESEEIEFDLHQADGKTISFLTSQREYHKPCYECQTGRMKEIALGVALQRGSWDPRKLEFRRTTGKKGRTVRI